jgi:hypothetical protein
MSALEEARSTIRESLGSSSEKARYTVDIINSTINSMGIEKVQNADGSTSIMQFSPAEVRSALHNANSELYNEIMNSMPGQASGIGKQPERIFDQLLRGVASDQYPIEKLQAFLERYLEIAERRGR